MEVTYGVTDGRSPRWGSPMGFIDGVIDVESLMYVTDGRSLMGVTDWVADGVSDGRSLMGSLTVILMGSLVAWYNNFLQGTSFVTLN